MYISIAHNITGKAENGETFIVHPKTRKMLKINSVTKEFLLFASSNNNSSIELNTLINFFKRKYKISDEESELLTFKLINYLYNEQLINIDKDDNTSKKKVSIYDEKSILTAYLTLTRRCNISCIGCTNQKNGEVNELSTDIWKRFIKQISEWGVMDLYFLGGEPLLRKDCITLLKEAENCGLPSNLYTNGLLLDENICNELSKIDSLSVQIYIPECSPNAYDSFMGTTNGFNQIIDIIKLLDKHNIRIGVITRLKNDTINQLDDFLRLLVNLNVTEWFPSIIIPVGCSAVQNVEEFNIDDENFKKFTDEYFNLISVYKDVINIKGTFNIHIFQNKNVSWGNDPNPKKHYEPIVIYNNWINIDSNGDLTPSYRLKGYSLGNIKNKTVNEMLSDTDLINSQKRRIYKELQGKNIIDRCDNCDYIRICGGALPEISLTHLNLINDWCDPVKCRFFHYGFQSLLDHSTPPSYDLLLKNVKN